MFSIFSVLESVRASCATGTTLSSPLNLKISIATSTDVAEDYCYKKVAKTSGHFTYVTNKDYIYSAAYKKPTNLKLATTVKAVYVKVVTNGLAYKPELPSIDSTIEANVRQLGNVYTVMAENNNTTDKDFDRELFSQMNPLTLTNNGDSNESGFVIKFTPEQFETLKALYFAVLGPVTNTIASASYDGTTKPTNHVLDLDISSPVINDADACKQSVTIENNKKLAPKAYPEETFSADAEYVKLAGLQELFDNKNDTTCRLSGEMLYRVLLVAQDDLLTKIITETCCEDKAFNATCDSEESCKEMVIAGAQTSAAYTCNTKNNTICNTDAVTCAANTTNSISMYNALNMLNFYNCTLQGNNFYFIFKNACEARYGITLGNAFTTEDFCDMFGITASDLSKYNEDLTEGCDISASEDKKSASKKSSKKSKTSTTSEAGFMSRNKGWFIAGGVIVGVGLIGGCGYMLL